MVEEIPQMRPLSLLLTVLAPAACRVNTASWVGSAYTPSGASNTMWWPWFTSYAAQIDRELAAASKHLKMNTLRVFLHPKVYEANATGLLASVDSFLSIAAKHGFSTGLVLFDSCWRTDGSNVSQQCAPQKGVHNGVRVVFARAAPARAAVPTPAQRSHTPTRNPQPPHSAGLRRPRKRTRPPCSASSPTRRT